MEVPPKPKRRRWQYSLRTLLILSFVTAGAMMWWFGRYGRWAAELADEKKRDAALFNLLQAQRYRDNPLYAEKAEGTQSECKVNHVLVSCPAHGETIFVVFKASTYKDDQRGPGIPKGHYIIIDSQGRILPLYSGANVMDGEVFSPSPDAHIQAADRIPYGLANGGGVSVLYVVDVSMPAEPLLLVAYNRDGDKAHWGWRVNKRNGLTEIEFGPQPENGVLQPEVRFTWSPAEHKYTGPEGAAEQHFMRLDRTKLSEQMNAFHEHGPK